MLLTPSLCHKLSHLLGPPPPSSVTYFMDGPKDGSDICRNIGVSLFQRDGTAMAKERLKNLSDEVPKGRSNVRMEEEQVERGGWIVDS